MEVFMHKTIKAILLAFILSLLTGCTIAPKHEVCERDGQFYLDGSRYNNGALARQIQLPSPLISGGLSADVMDMINQCVVFDSVAEMKQGILQGNFNEDEIRKIKEMYVMHTKLGKLWFLPDLNNLYEPILPEGFTSYTVEWNCEDYSLCAENENGRISLTPISRESYDLTAEIMKEGIKKNGNDSVYYAINTGTAEYYVRSLGTSSSLMVSVTVYGISSDQCFRASIRYNRYTVDEMIAGIGLKPFSE